MNRNHSGGRRNNNRGHRGGGRSNRNRKNGWSGNNNNNNGGGGGGNWNNNNGGGGGNWNNNGNNNSGGNNFNNNNEDPNVKEILYSNTIMELNNTKKNPQDKFLIEGAELINGVVVLEVKNREHCLVFDTGSKSFKNKQYYLHPEIRGSYKIYKGSMPNFDKDILLVTHAFKNLLIDQNTAYLIIKPKLDFKNCSTDIDIPVSQVNAIDMVHMSNGLLFTSVWDNKNTLFCKVYGISKVDFSKGISEIKTQLETVSKEFQLKAPIGCCDIMGTMLLGGVRYGNGIMAVDLANGNVNNINNLHNPQNEVVGIKCINLVNNRNKAEFVVSVDNSGMIVLWNQQMNKITFNLNAPIMFFDIAQIQEGKYIAIFGDYRGIIHIVAIYGEIKKIGEINRFHNPRFKDVRKGSTGIFNKIFLRIVQGVPYVFMVTSRAEICVCAYNIAGN